jgi:hypothetical protein
MRTLEEIYNDPRTGLGNVNKFITQVRKEGHTLSPSEVRTWYREQAANQVFQQPRIRGDDFIPIKCPLNRVGCLQADLMDVSKYAGQNRGVKFLLNVIDVNSRRAWSRAIKSKKPASLLPHVKEILTEIQSHVPEFELTFTSDDGTEFKGAVRTYLKQQGVTQYQSDHKTNTAVVERFQRTLWNMFRKYSETRGKYNFVSVLPAMMENYNDSYHRGILMTPQQAYEARGVVDNRERKVVSLVVGTRVRVLQKQETFAKKSFTAKYSRKVHYVVGRKKNRYQVSQSKGGAPLARTYLARELMVVSESSQSQPNRVQRLVDEVNRERTVSLRQQREPAFQGSARPVEVRRGTRQVRPSRRLVEAMLAQGDEVSNTGGRDRGRRQVRPTQRLIESMS